MSEVKLNLIDNQQVLHGRIHGSVADRCVAALSAEPETIAELSAALARYEKPVGGCRTFSTFHSSSHSEFPLSVALDPEPWDAGLVVIDLTARIVACESTYSQPGPEGEVDYHDGTKATDIAVLYRLPDDWLFVNSVEAYKWSRDRRAEQRRAQTPLDVREVLYGTPLLNFVIDECAKIEISATDTNGNGAGQRASASSPARNSIAESSDSITNTSKVTPDSNATPDVSGLVPEACEASADVSDAIAAASEVDDDPINAALSQELSAIHARWLMTPREDLRGESPRDVMLAKQDFIDFDLHTRSLQWSFQDEGPPCLSPDSFAYRYAGFGTHEWVIYYDLVRQLLWNAVDLNSHHLSASTLWSAPTGRGPDGGKLSPHASHENLISRDHHTAQTRETLLVQLEKLKSDWLDQPHPDYDGRTPAILIENERKRLPIALRARDMIIDENCPMCQMFGDETSPLGMGVGFWHLDGCNMDDDFAFSHFRTREEWEAENRSREEFSREFDRKWKERQERIACGEEPEPDPFFDPDPFPGLEFSDPSSSSDESMAEDEKEHPH